MSAAFGGGMTGGVLGSKTGDVLTWITISLVAVFLFLAVLMAKFYKPSISDMASNTSQQTTSLPADDVNGTAAPVAPTPGDTNAPVE